ncbi:MAG: DMT family transporter [Candidatus Dormibacteria bacterium]
MQPATLGVVGLLLAALVWGLSFVVTRGAIGGYPVIDFLFLRFALGGLTLALLALLSPASRRSWRGAPKGNLLLLGAVLAVAYFTQTVGLELGAAPGVAAALASLVVVITPALEWGLHGKSPDPKVWVGALLAVGGSLLVCLSAPGPASTQGSSAALGLLLELVAAAAFSLQMVLVGQLGNRMPAMALGAWQLLALAAVLGFALPFSGGLAPPSSGVLLDVIFCGLAASAFAFAVQAAAQRHISSPMAALIMAIEPGVALVGAAVTGIEAITPLALLGLLLLGGGSGAQGGSRLLRLLRQRLSRARLRLA